MLLCCSEPIVKTAFADTWHEVRSVFGPSWNHPDRQQAKTSADLRKHLADVGCQFGGRRDDAAELVWVQLGGGNSRNGTAFKVRQRHGLHMVDDSRVDPNCVHRR